MRQAANAPLTSAQVADSTTAPTYWDDKLGPHTSVPSGTTQTATALAETYKHYTGVLARGDKIKPDAANAHTFAASYYNKPEEQKAWEESIAYGDQLAANTKLQVSASVPTAVSNWTEAREKAALMVQFDAYVEKTFINGNIQEREWIKNKYPAYFEARINEVDARQALDKKVFMLKLLGPSNMEDVQLQWMLSEGLLALPTRPIWDNTGDYPADKALERGIFNARKKLPSATRDIKGGILSTGKGWAAPDSETGAPGGITGDLLTKIGQLWPNY